MKYYPDELVSKIYNKDISTINYHNAIELEMLNEDVDLRNKYKNNNGIKALKAYK